jgi:hypothetical protein
MSTHIPAQAARRPHIQSPSIEYGSALDLGGGWAFAGTDARQIGCEPPQHLNDEFGPVAREQDVH